MEEILDFLAAHRAEFFLGLPGLILSVTFLLKIARWWILRSKAKHAANQQALHAAAIEAEVNNAPKVWVDQQVRNDVIRAIALLQQVDKSLASMERPLTIPNAEIKS